MSDEGSIPSGRAAPDGLENQVVSEGATGQASSVWSGVGPKRRPYVGQWVRVRPDGKGGFAGETMVTEVCDLVRTDGGAFCCGAGEWYFVDSRGKTWDFTLEDLALMASADVAHGKGGVPDLPAVPEAKRCRGLTEINHTWTCDAALGPDEGDQCAHCRNLEAQIRAEDLAVEETERRDAENAVAYEQLLAAHQGDARAVAAGVLRTLVTAGAISDGNARVLKIAAEGVIGHAFEQAANLTGLPLMLFWSLLADMAQAERNSLRRANADAFKGCA